MVQHLRYQRSSKDSYQKKRQANKDRGNMKIFVCENVCLA
jgi:hypothetical protein